MPLIERFGCNKCEFQFPTGWGSYVYAIDARGARIVCPHPGEVRSVQEITGMSYEDAKLAGRVGAARYAVCLACLHQFDIDLEKDERRCPKCATSEIQTALEAVGQLCPACNVGTIERGSPFRPVLDADWEQLPVPQVVKDLVFYEKTRKVPESLKAAFEAAESVGKFAFISVVLRLLEWWEGSFVTDRQKPSVQMHREGLWRQAFPKVLAAAPALADLVTIEGDCCRFSPVVSDEVRRGIKNYLRKHREHLLQC